MRTKSENKLLFCKKCKMKTEHIPTGFRKVFEPQWYRCLNCGEERV